MSVQDIFAEVEFRPAKSGDGDPILAAYVDGKYLGTVITESNGRLMIRLAERAVRRRKESNAA